MPEGVGRPAARTFAWGGFSTLMYGPGSGPSTPAYRAPRPTPSSSAMRTSSPMPPSGPGPEQATAVARPPLRSSPAKAAPVNSQPTGSGHGIHTGTRARCTTTPRASTLGGITGCSGCTVPCTSHCQESAKRPGALTRPPHFGQLGSPLIGPNGPPRPCPRQGRSPVRRVHITRDHPGRHPGKLDVARIIQSTQPVCAYANDPEDRSGIHIPFAVAVAVAALTTVGSVTVSAN